MDDRLPLKYAVDAVTVSAHIELHGYWTLTIALRRANQTWSDVEPDKYQGLTTEELATVLQALSEKL